MKGMGACNNKAHLACRNSLEEWVKQKEANMKSGNTMNAEVVLLLNNGCFPNVEKGWVAEGGGGTIPDRSRSVSEDT